MSSNTHPELSPDSIAYAESHHDVEAAALRLQRYVGLEIHQVRYFGVTVDPEDNPEWAAEWVEHGWKQEDNLDFGLELTFGNDEHLSIYWLRFLESLHLHPVLFTDAMEEIHAWDVTAHWLPKGPRKLSELIPVYLWDHWFGHEREALGMQSLTLTFTDGGSIVVDLITHDTIAVSHSVEAAQSRGALTRAHPEAVFYDHQRKSVMGPTSLTTKDSPWRDVIQPRKGPL